MKHTFVLFFFLSVTGLAAQKYADCDSANYICHKSTYVFHQCSGEGQNTKEADWSSCFLNGTAAGEAEKNSTWMKFHIKEAGKLMFIIAPKDSLDDIDFVVLN